jgi:Holliday junction resolvasome RuvABC endonuclease subunit
MTIAAIPVAPAPAGAAPAARLLRIAGLDISLTGTGVATTTGTISIPTNGKRNDSLTMRHHRFQRIIRAVFDELGHCDLAVVEDAAYAAVGGSKWDRGGLWWLIIDGLLDREIPVALVSPKSRAKYATGNGSAGKAAVMRAAQQTYGAITRDDNQADALILRAMGHDWAGQPLAAVPDLNRTALLSCQWPDPAEVNQ